MDNDGVPESDADISNVIANPRIDGRIRPLFSRMEKGDAPADGYDKLGRLEEKSGVISGQFNQYARLGEGFYLVSAVYPEYAEISTTLTGEGLFEVHFCLKGSLRLSGSWGEVRVNGPRLLFWCHPENASDVFEEVIAGEAGYVGVSVYCDQQWLERQALNGDETIVSVWRQFVNMLVDIPQFRVLPLPTDSISALDDVLRNVREDGLTFLQLKGRAFALFASAFQAHASMVGDERTSKFKASDIHKISSARDIIQSDFVNPPSNRELARAVGLNVSKLMAGFQDQYGETIRGVVTNLRMEEARRLLLTTDFQVNLIAYKVGYAHHSTFTTAFTSFFSESPKQVIASRDIIGNIVYDDDYQSD